MNNELIEENINLARKYAWDYYRKNPNFMEYDDLIQLCSIALVKAVRSYNGKNTLSTYAYKCMNNEIKSEIRKKNMKKRQAIFISFEEPSFDNLTIKDTLKSDYDIYETIIEKEENAQLISLINQLDTTKKFIITKKLEGYNQEKIADMLNTSQAQVSREYNKAIKEMRKKINH